MITLLVGGFWHGPHWKFLIWGGIHGLALILYKASLDIRRDMGINPRADKPLWWLFIGWAYTFHICVIARLFFRAPDFDTIGRYFAGLGDLSLIGQGFELSIVAVCLLVLWMNFYGDWLRRQFIALHDGLGWGTRPVLWAIIAVLVLALQPSDIAPYIYYGF